jgi:2-aminoethylphosphonate dioxygenase
LNDTWSHAAARTLVRPLVGTWVRPNHITFMRLATGAVACLLLALGGSTAELWSGILWLISAFLDRADGELARVGKMQSRRGHLFDYYTDVMLNSAFFLAAGINLRHGALGLWAIPTGIVACTAMIACCLLSEAYEQDVATGERVWEGGWGFQPDDALYLLPLFVWMHWLAPILVAAAIITSIIAATILVRYLLLKRRLAGRAGTRAIAAGTSDAAAMTGGTTAMRSESMARSGEGTARRGDATARKARGAPGSPDAQPGGSDPLTEAQVAHYRGKAWVAVPGFFSAAETTAISDWVEELERRPERPGVEMVYHEPSLADSSVQLVQRIENFCPHHENFDALVHGRLKAAVERLLGERAVLFKDKINFKMAGGAGFDPHQDQQAGWSTYASLFITALVSIDAATIENGCLQIADAPRFSGLIGEEWKPLTSEQMASFSMDPVPCAPGDVIFFDSYVPHASEPNATDKARRILYLTYNAESQGDHRAQYFADKRANFPPDVERKPGAEYKFRV